MARKDKWELVVCIMQLKHELHDAREKISSLERAPERVEPNMQVGPSNMAAPIFMP